MTTRTRGELHTVGNEIFAPSDHVNAHGMTCSQLLAVALEKADANSGDDGHPDRSEQEADANAARLALCWNTLEAFDDATVERLGCWLAAHNGDDLNEMLEEEGIE